MPDTATVDQITKAVSNPAYGALSSEQKDQLFSHLVPSFGTLDSKQKEQFIGEAQKKFGSKASTATPPPPGLSGMPKSELPKGPEAPAGPPKPGSKAGAEPPKAGPQASVGPPKAAVGPQQGPQIQAEESKPKVGPAFVRSLNAIPKGATPQAEEQSYPDKIGNAFKAATTGNLKPALDVAFTSPVNMKAVDDQLSNFLVGPFSFYKGAIEAGIQAGTTPGNLGIGGLIGVAGKAAQAITSPVVRAAWETADTALSAYFAGQMGTAAAKKGKEAYDLLRKKDYEGAAKTLGFASTDAFFAYAGAARAIQKGLDIKQGIQEGVSLGKLKGAMQDELYRRETERRTQEREARKPKQITARQEAPTEGEPPKPGKPISPALQAQLDAAKRVTRKAFEVSPEEAPPEAPAKEAQAPPGEPNAVPPAVTASVAAAPVPEEVKTASTQAASVVESGTPPKQEIIRKAAEEANQGDPATSVLVPRKGIEVDPQRFQYKRAFGQGGVVEDSLSNVKRWNQRNAGPIYVWRDPANDKTYVVNGHNRLALANRAPNKPDKIEAKYLDATTAQEARMQGAILNIAEKSGTSLDSAQLFRESNFTLKDFEEQDLDVSNKIATEGWGISQLAQPLYQATMDGELKPSQAALIGNGLPNQSDQMAVARAIEKRKQSGKNIEDSTVKEIIRRATSVEMQHAEKPSAQTRLFGDEDESGSSSLIAEEAEVSEYARKQIATEKKLFTAVGKEAAAERLGKAGNVLKADQNKLVAEQAATAQALYDKLSGKSGEVSDILREAAGRIADGESPNKVKELAYERIRESLSKVIPRGEGAGASGSQEASQAPPSVPGAVAGGTGGGEPPATAGPEQSASLGLFEPPAKDTGEPPLGPEAGSIRISLTQEEKARINAAKERAKEWGENTLDLVKSVFPRVGVPKEGLTLMLKALGERNQQRFQLQQTSGEIKDYFTRMPQWKQIDYVDDVKRGIPQADPYLAQIASLQRNGYDAAGDWLESQNSDFHKIENYMRVFYKKVPGTTRGQELAGSSGTGRRPFQGSKGYLKHQTLPDLSSGLRWDLRIPVADLEAMVAASKIKMKPEEYKIGSRPDPNQPLFTITEFVPKSEKAQKFANLLRHQAVTILREGGELWTYNPQEMYERALGDVMSYASAQRMIQLAKSNGLMKYIKGPKDAPVERTPKGWVDIDDKIGKVYLKAKSGEGFVQPGRWVMQKDWGRIFNNHVSEDLIRKHPAGNLVIAIKQAHTGWLLSISPFHLMAESFEAIGSSMGMGMSRTWNVGVKQWKPDEILKGVLEIAGAPFSPITMSKYGGDVTRGVLAETMAGSAPPGDQSYVPPSFATLQTQAEGTLAGNVGRAIMGRQRQITPKDLKIGGKFVAENPEVIQHLNELMMSGLKLSLPEDFKINYLRSFWQSGYDLTHGNKIPKNALGVLWKAYPALNEAIMKPLFEVYIPRLKIAYALKSYGLYLQDYSKELAEGKVTREELARKAVNSVDYRFGLMNWDNSFYSRTTKSALQFAFTSFTWRGGTVGQFYNAGVEGVKGLLVEPIKFVNEESKKPGGFEYTAENIRRSLPRIAQDLGWAFGTFFALMLMAEAVDHLLTGKGPVQHAKETGAKGVEYFKALWTEYMHPRPDNQLDDRGKPNHITPANYMSRDLDSFMRRPGNYLVGGTSPGIANVYEALQNRDHFDNYVWDPDDKWYKVAKDALVHVVGDPFIVRTILEERKSGASKQEMILGALGFPKADRDVGLTAAEREARDRGRTKYRMKPQEIEAAQTRRTMVARLKSGDKEVLSTPEYQDLRGRKRTAIRTKVRNDYLKQEIKGLGVVDALAVWNKATPQERDDIRTIVRGKRRLIREINDKAERQRVQQQFDKLFPPLRFDMPPTEDYVPPLPLR